jgi:hypothetical protein
MRFRHWKKSLFSLCSIALTDDLKSVNDSRLFFLFFFLLFFLLLALFAFLLLSGFFLFFLVLVISNFLDCDNSVQFGAYFFANAVD